MKTVQGMLGQEIVNALRDTGCTGVIVKQWLVPEGAFTGEIFNEILYIHIRSLHLEACTTYKLK